MTRSPLRMFILKDAVPYEVTDTVEWARWFEDNISVRTVAYSQVGDSTVSTTFIGLSNRGEDGPPLLFETAVFGGPLAGRTERYATYQEAYEGHLFVVGQIEAQQVRNGGGSG